jgi:hypothetical protein
MGYQARSFIAKGELDRGILFHPPPLLFVLAVDLLQSIVNKAKDSGLLSLPIEYADDTLMIMEASSQ